MADKLDEIVNARHVVAHTASALAIARADLVEWHKFVLVFANLIDMRLARYVTNVVGGAAMP